MRIYYLKVERLDNLIESGNGTAARNLPTFPLRHLGLVVQRDANRSGPNIDLEADAGPIPIAEPDAYSRPETHHRHS